MTSFGSHLLLFLAIGLQLYDVTSWSFLPVHEPVVPRMSGFLEYTTTFICQADTPLTKCQVNLLNYNVLIDLSQGSDSGEIRRPEHGAAFSFLYYVSYNGTGLENGQCGATFVHYVGGPGIHYGCRGADENGEWHAMDFIVDGPTRILPASITPREVIVMPGNNVSVLLKTDTVLGKCFVNLGFTIARSGLNNSYVEYPPFKSDGNDFRFYGAGPANGECGTTLLNVAEKHNGPIRHIGDATENRSVLRITNVIVASPPTITSFNVNKLKYSVGDTLNATCSSLLSRPVANLTWTLDDRIIRQDGIDDEFQEDVWSWPWNKKSITQRMSITLEEEHFGKKLECSVQHLALTNQQYDFNYLITKVYNNVIIV